MNEALVNNWNSVVKPEDTVYYLGDFGFGSAESLINYANQLNGTKHMIWGNHDKELQKYRGDTCFVTTSHYKEITIENQFIVLSHYAFLVWNKCHRSSWNLFGHSHNSLPVDMTVKRLDVGVD